VVIAPLPAHFRRLVLEPQIYEDSRQQIKPVDKHAKKHLWWKGHGVAIERRKLDYGDYIRADGMSNISIDTKANMQEICGNLGKDHARVVREVERASNDGFRLVFLIEVGGNYRCIDDVERWTNDVCKRCGEYRAKACDPSRDRCRRFKRKPMQGTTLAKIMRGMERDHGCRFEFAHPLMAAKRICDVLGVEYGR
jgi:hypothetical protein